MGSRARSKQAKLVSKNQSFNALSRATGSRTSTQPDSSTAFEMTRADRRSYACCVLANQGQWFSDGPSHETVPVPCEHQSFIGQPSQKRDFNRLAQFRMAWPSSMKGASESRDWIAPPERLITLHNALTAFHSHSLGQRSPYHKSLFCIYTKPCPHLPPPSKKNFSGLLIPPLRVAHRLSQPRQHPNDARG